MQGEQPEENSSLTDRSGAEQTPSWDFRADEPAATTPGDSARPPIEPHEPVQWTASEYIAHHKTSGWFFMVGAVTIVLAVVVYFVSRADKISTTMMLVVGTVFGIIGARVPRVLQYGLDDSGLHIGPKFYAYDQFKSFAIMDEGAISSITLLPLKRFMPSISIYYAPDDEEKIVNVLSLGLPIEHREQDALDRLMRRLRF